MALAWSREGLSAPKPHSPEAALLAQCIDWLFVDHTAAKSTGKTTGAAFKCWRSFFSWERIAVLQVIGVNSLLIF